MFKKILFSVVFALFLKVGAVSANSSVIDVHFIYWSDLDNGKVDVNTFISDQVNYANSVLKNSKAGVALNVKSIEKTSFQLKITNEQIKFYTDTVYDFDCSKFKLCTEYLIDRIKRQSQSDYVVFVTKKEGGVCGKAMTNTGSLVAEAFAKKALSMIAIDCSNVGSMALIHELGHNFGIAHPIEVDPDPKRPMFRSSASGYGSVGKFFTVLGYPITYGKALAINSFSEAGKIVKGYKIGNKESADAVITVRENAPIIARTKEILEKDLY